MKTAWATVIGSERLYGNTCVLWLHAPQVTRGAAPGQFLMLRCNEDGPPMLPRPMSYHRLRAAEGGGHDFAILFDLVGRGTQWLSQRRPGDSIFVYGPLGRGCTVRRSASHLLLVAGGIGVAPLVWLAEEQVSRGRNVTLLQGARSAGDLFPARLLPPEVEVVVATDDGSAGQRGLVTDLVPEYLPWADQVFACGPNAMFGALADVVRRFEGEGARRRQKSIQVLLEEVMPCGTGICYGCAVRTRRGVRLICKDGPRFELRDVFS